MAVQIKTALNSVRDPMSNKPPAPTTPKFPSPEDFFLNKGLYDKQVYVGEEMWEAVDVLYFQGTYDSYCVQCQKGSTFRLAKADTPLELQKGRQQNVASQRSDMFGVAGFGKVLPEIRAGFYNVSAACTRHAHHVHKFYFRLGANNEYMATPNSKVSLTLEKIGQHPAIADLAIPLTKQFRSVLTKEQLQELNKAIGLHSHGVGAGAYVYLRRIFEALIEEAHQEAKKDSGWDDDAYGALKKTKERIDAVKAHLPDFLVQNKQMYSVLSLGIHSLSEEECMKYFNTMKTGIEMILEEKLDRKNKADRIAKANKAIQEAHQDLSQPPEL